MSQEELPSRTSIVFGMVATGSALISTAWIGTGLWSEREVAGFVLGLVASLLLLTATIGRIITREELLRQQRRREVTSSAFISGFEKFVPADNRVSPVWNDPQPDVTARIYREPPTEVIRINGSDW